MSLCKFYDTKMQLENRLSKCLIYLHAKNMSSKVSFVNSKF